MIQFDDFSRYRIHRTNQLGFNCPLNSLKWNTIWEDFFHFLMFSLKMMHHWMEIVLLELKYIYVMSEQKRNNEVTFLLVSIEMLDKLRQQMWIPVRNCLQIEGTCVYVHIYRYSPKAYGSWNQNRFNGVMDHGANFFLISKLFFFLKSDRYMFFFLNTRSSF